MGRMGSYRDLLGPIKTPRDVWGQQWVPMGTSGELWRRNGAHWDLWGPIRPIGFFGDLWVLWAPMGIHGHRDLGIYSDQATELTTQGSSLHRHCFLNAESPGPSGKKTP